MSSSNGLPVVVIACQVLQDLLQPRSVMPSDLDAQVTFMDYGLHRVPSKMTWTVQDAINAVEQPSLIVLGYGLCGNGLNGIQAGKHTLLVPRADDCIALLLGSVKAYLREFNAVPGTYWLSKGWLESGSHPLKEYQEYQVKYGSDKAMWLMDQQYRNYKRLVFVAHRQEDLDRYRSVALDVAHFCERWGMRYEEILGSDRYVRRLVEIAGDLSKADGEFLIVPPGGVIQQAQFIR
jgi:hypothetical protein